jgi:hypothetical protein
MGSYSTWYSMLERVTDHRGMICFLLADKRLQMKREGCNYAQHLFVSADA